MTSEIMDMESDLGMRFGFDPGFEFKPSFFIDAKGIRCAIYNLVKPKYSTDPRLYSLNEVDLITLRDFLIECFPLENKNDK